MIRLEGVEKSYGQTRVLKGIDLEVGEGEFLSVTGSSGSGKSTLLNLIGAMDNADRGRIIIDGEEISSYSEEQLTLHRRKRIGFIFQSFNLLPNITVFENVELPLLLNGMRDEGRVIEMIRRVGLEEKQASYPYHISGGEQQRVAIARALVHDPDIILADEPTGSLDSHTGVMIMDLIKKLMEAAGKTIVMVTHEHHVARYADRIVTIRDGVIGTGERSRS
ncbi:MAG TPA: ABC transporter ATP-binding protein [Thermodesulfovibrionales bacterium]|nr:ABC transporter ATP-binding protein [Thermodesulfovibrionales bacterium]